MTVLSLAAWVLSSVVATTDRIVVAGDGLLSEALSAPARTPFPEIEWRADGCRAAFEALLSGTADIAASRRPPNARELALARRLGLLLREHVVGFDALAVIVHPDNRVEDLSLDQLASVFSGGVVRWLGVGGPDEGMRLVVPSPRSGALELFRELTLDGGELGAVETVETATDLVSLIASDVSAVGIVSMSADRSTVKTLSIDGESPTPEAVARGRYPLWYPLTVYTLGQPEGPTHQFLAWLVLQDGQSRISDAGLVPLRVSAPLRRTVVDRGLPSAPSGVLFRVYFRRGSVFLRPSEREPVDLAVSRAASSSDRLFLAAHAEDGERETIARERARTVTTLLTRGGISPERVELEPVGGGAAQSEPIASDPASNRRVDIWLLPRR